MRRRHKLTRAERAALARRDRAQAHLSRLRGRGAGGLRSRVLGAPAAALAVALGALLGAPLAATATRWLSRPDLAAIHVRGAARIPAAEVAAGTGLAPGGEMQAIDTAAVEARLREHPWIATAQVVRAPGGHLLVEVRERVPRASLELGKPAESWAVDAEGVPFARVPAEELAHLPRLMVDFAVPPRQADAQLSEAVALAEQLLRRGLESPFQVTVADADDPEGYGLRLPETGTRVVLGRDALDERLDALLRLLAAGVADLERTARIDLRFEDQAVLRHESPRNGATQAAPETGADPASEARPSG